MQTPLQRKKNEAFSQNAKKGIKPTSAKKAPREDLEDPKVEFRRKVFIYIVLGMFLLGGKILYVSRQILILSELGVLSFLQIFFKI